VLPSLEVPGTRLVRLHSAALWVEDIGLWVEDIGMWVGLNAGCGAADIHM
jgi:hypothetical protein